MMSAERGGQGKSACKGSYERKGRAHRHTRAEMKGREGMTAYQGSNECLGIGMKWDGHMLVMYGMDMFGHG